MRFGNYLWENFIFYFFTLLKVFVCGESFNRIHPITFWQLLLDSNSVKDKMSCLNKRVNWVLLMSVKDIAYSCKNLLDFRHVGENLPLT